MEVARGNGRIGAFDGLRAYALLAIVAMHIFGIAGVVAVGKEDTVSRVLWVLLGNTIDLFFVISGFLLFLPVLRRGGLRGGALHFYARRAARIQPEYWACLVAVFLMIVLIPVAFRPPVPGPGQVLLHVFDLQTAARLLDPELQVGFWIDGALWMIPVLVGLYIAFPPFARLMLRHPWLALLLSLAMTVGWKVLAHEASGLFEWLAGGAATGQQRLIIAVEQSPSFAWSFGVGMVAALLYRRAEESPGSWWEKRLLPAALVFATLLWILVGIRFSQEAMLTTTGFDGSSLGRTLILPNLVGTACRGVLVLAVALGPAVVLRLFDNGFASIAARLSYGVYLIHLPIAFYAAQLLDLPRNGGLGSVLVWAAVLIPTSALWAWLSHRYVGQPSIGWTEKRLKGKAN